MSKNKKYILVISILFGILMILLVAIIIKSALLNKSPNYEIINEEYEILKNTTWKNEKIEVYDGDKKIDEMTNNDITIHFNKDNLMMCYNTQMNDCQYQNFNKNIMLDSIKLNDFKINGKLMLLNNSIVLETPSNNDYIFKYYFSKKEEDNSKINYDLIGTKWTLDNTETITNEGTFESPGKYDNIELEFFESYVNVCGFNFKGESLCSKNKFDRDGNTYKIEKDALTSVYGTVKFDENGNIYLEQEDTEDYKTVYYFIKM